MKTFPRKVASLIWLGLLMLACVGNVAAQGTAWLSAQKTGGLAHFFFANRIERYDLATRQWQAPIVLPTTRGNATAGWVDAQGIYVAYDKAVYRYALNGGGETALLNTSLSVNAGGLITNASYLYIVYGGYNILSVRKTDNAIIQDNTSGWYSMSGLSIAPTLGKIFGRTTSVSPADIVGVTVAANGTTGSITDSPHHGDYPSATKTWIFPNEGRVVDSAGIVYATGGLNYLASFGSAISDLQFLGSDVPIVLNGNKLTAYTNALLPAGSLALAFSPQSIFLDAADILCFTPDAVQASGVRVDAVAQSLLSAPTPGQPVSAVGLPFTPDATFLDQNGILHLYSKTHLSLFRWNPATQQFLPTIPLIGAADFVAYSAASHRVYLAYSSGLIRKIDLADPNLAEVPFANLPTAPLGLATAGAYCFAADGSGAWNTHYTFDAAGTLVDSVDWNYYSTEYIWSDANQKMYFFRDDTSPNDLLWEEINANGTAYAGEPAGGLRNKIDSPLHDSTGFSHPIRVSPDGSAVVLGSGVIHQGTTLARLSTALANAINDAAWLNGELRTVRSISGVAQFQQWLAPNYSQGNTRQLPGTAHRLLTLNATKQVAVTIAANGIPSFYVLDAAFQVIPPAALEAPTQLKGGIAGLTQIDLTWRDGTGEESYQVERKTGPDGTWATIGTTTTSVTTFSDSAAVAGQMYLYRVIAINGGLQSSPSAEVSVQMSVPAVPTGLVATANSTSQITVTWSDVATETAFLLERKTGVGGAWALISTLGPDTLSYTSTSLSTYTQYFFRLRAGNGLGNSAYSSEVSATTFAVPPAAPTILSASASAFSVTLSWLNVSYEDNFVLERRVAPAGAWSVVASPTVNTTSYVDSTVASSTAYDYRVKAVNIAGESPYSANYSVTTPAPPPPSTPTGFSVQVVSATALRISWNDVSNETGYRLERRTDGPVVWTTVATLAANTTSYVDSGVVPGVENIYRLVALNAVGASNYTAETGAIPYAVSVLIDDHFDPQINSQDWQSINGGVAINGGVGFRGSNALWFGASGARSATTVALDLSLGGTLRFAFRAGNTALHGATYWESSETGEGVVLEYSTGGAWTTLQSFTTTDPAYGTWVNLEVTIPLAARSPQTAFRWRQLTHSGASFDTWALEDVAVQGAPPAAPAAPSFIIASAISDTAVSIYWQPSAGARSYVVERSTPGGDWASVATIPASASYFTDTARLPQTWYGYRIRAVNLGGSSPVSQAAYAVTYGQLDAWRLANFGQTEPTGPAGSLVLDRDGVPNLLKYAFNLPVGPQAASLVLGAGIAGMPVAFLDQSGEGLCIEFVRRISANSPGIAYTVEFSDDCVTWVPGGTVVSVTPIDSLWERVCVGDDQGGPRRFVRVSVSEL